MYFNIILPFPVIWQYNCATESYLKIVDMFTSYLPTSFLNIIFLSVTFRTPLITQRISSSRLFYERFCPLFAKVFNLL
jgi:hypothetical protein